MNVVQAVKEQADFELDVLPWKDIFQRPKKCFSCISPQSYVVVRVAVCLLWLGATISSIIDWVVIHDLGLGYWFTKLTHIGALWELLYFAFAAFSTYMAVYGGVPDGKRDSTPWFVSATWFLSSGVLVITFVVFSLYWALLFDPAGGAPAVVSVVMHGGNFALAFLDFAYSRRPVYLIHVWVPFAFAGVYALFTYIYYKAGGTFEDGVSPYIYPVIDWSGDADGARSLLGLVVLVVVPAIYSMFYCVYFCHRAHKAYASRFHTASGVEATTARDVERGGPTILGMQAQSKE